MYLGPHQEAAWVEPRAQLRVYQGDATAAHMTRPPRLLRLRHPVASAGHSTAQLPLSQVSLGTHALHSLLLALNILCGDRHYTSCNCAATLGVAAHLHSVRVCGKGLSLLLRLTWSFPLLCPAAGLTEAGVTSDAVAVPVRASKRVKKEAPVQAQTATLALPPTPHAAQQLPDAILTGEPASRRILGAKA